MVCRDLTFIHLGNESLIEDLINFEKLRMLAKEVRTKMTSILFPTFYSDFFLLFRSVP